MKNKIILGDCLDVMKDIPDGSIDLTVTSPPYDKLRTYNNKLVWGETIWKDVIENLFWVTKDGGVVVWIVGDETINGSETGTSFKQALWAMEIGFKLHDTMIWNKGCFSAVGSLKVRYAPTFEYMFIFSKGKPSKFNPIKDRKNNKVSGKIGGRLRLPDGSMKQMSTQGKQRAEYGQRFAIWNQSPCGGNKTEHPAPFPEQLACDHIISWSTEGDIVLDPFIGSGTTAVACINTKRNFIGIEKDEKYWKIANDRITNYTKQLKIFDF